MPHDVIGRWRLVEMEQWDRDFPSLREVVRTQARGCVWMQHRFKRIVAAAALLFCVQASLLAEDIMTKSERLLKNATIVSIEDDQITIKHDGGTERFSASQIPDPVQKRFHNQALARKAEEVEKLKQELARREQELQQLKEANQRLRRDTEDKRAVEAEKQARREAELKKLREENERLAREHRQASSAPVAAGEKPSLPIEELAEATANEVIDARDLVLCFKSDPVAARQFFGGKTFRIRGVVEKFNPARFIRRYEVLLESPDKSLNVVCKFAYPAQWNAVYTRERGRLLVAKEGASEKKLMKAGETVTLRAHCEGLQASDLEFGRCELVR